jgi:hypothetical protein
MDSALGVSVADALLSRPISLLPPRTRFEGAGVYAIYYAGDLPLYKPISDQNRNGAFNKPIYVGRAVPRGSRKGGSGLDAPPGRVLYERLCHHAKSISAAHSLNIADFSCRYLIVDDIWIPLGESLLIQMFTPVWNQVLDGFGMKEPGEPRYGGELSKWDTVHPGRPWSEKCKPNAKSKKQIEDEVSAFLSQR